MKFKGKKLIASFLCALSLGLFTPAKVEAYAAENIPDIVGEFAVTMDYETGEIIYAKELDDRAYPASTTKVLTGLVFAEHANKSDKIPYTEDAKKQPPYSLLTDYNAINTGDTMTADDVMKSLLLYSANDAAYMIADYVSGSAAKFADLMNQKIKELGLKNTNFVTPNGLHDDNHYSSAYDLAVILREAYKNPWVSEVMGLETATVHISNGKNIALTNRNRFINDNGNVAGKTGFTNPAGRCLVGIYEKDGRKIVGTVLKSAYDAQDISVFNDMNTIIDYSFDVEKTTLFKAGDVIATVPVSYKAFRFFGPTKTIDVPMTLVEDVTYYDNEANKQAFKPSTVDIGDMSAWKLASNSDSAKVTITDGRIYSKDYALKADISVGKILKANAGLYALTLGIALVVIIVILLVIRIINVRNRRNRRRKRIF